MFQNPLAGHNEPLKLFKQGSVGNRVLLKRPSILGGQNEREILDATAGVQAGDDDVLLHEIGRVTGELDFRGV